MLASRHHGIEVLWQRAVDRGEVRIDTSPDLAMDILFGPVTWRLLNARKPLSERDIGALVEFVLRSPRTTRHHDQDQDRRQLRMQRNW